MSDFEFKPVRLVDWLAEVEASPEPEWLIENFMANDSLTLISGIPKKSRKSWFAIMQALALTTGQQLAVFKPTRKLNVLYCYHEGAKKRTAKRFRMLQKSYGLPDKAFANLFWAHREMMDLRNPLHCRTIATFCQQNSIELVVFDTLAKSMLGDENAADNMGLVIRGIEYLRSKNLSVLLLHHLRKDPQPANAGIDIDSDLRGSGSLAGAYETHQAIRFDKNGNPFMLVEHKDSEQVGFSHEWTFQDQVKAELTAGVVSEWEDIFEKETDDK